LHEYYHIIENILISLFTIIWLNLYLKQYDLKLNEVSHVFDSLLIFTRPHITLMTTGQILSLIEKALIEKNYFNF
jgi:hypothetical protein